MRSEKLKLLGFNESIRGVQFMDSALLIIENANTVHMIDLYANVAEVFRTTPVNISSGIRYAIKKWWIVAPLKVKRKHFQMNCNLGKPPTNKEFLLHIANENVNAFKED